MAWVLSGLYTPADMPQIIKDTLCQGNRVRNARFLALVLLVASGCDNAPGPPSPEGAGVQWKDCDSDAPKLAQAFNRIEDMLAERQELQAIPGMAAGIVCANELAWASGYGVLALDDPRSVTPESRFRIASITKVFTATAIMNLVGDRAINLDDSVSRHLEWFEIQRPQDFGDAPVTIKQLLTHTSGLPRDSRLTDFRRLYQPPREKAIAALPSQSLRAPPGESNAYSNLGYGILGEIIAESSGASYAEYLEQSILEPLGMEETLAHPAPEDDVAWGYGPRREGDTRAKAGFWELGFATPAGGMASSVSDLSRFMILHLAPYSQSEPTILSAPLLKQMHEIQFVIDPERGGVGLGWAVEISEDQHVVYHGGELPEQTSFMLIDLRTKVGVVVLTNAQDANPNEMAQEILRIVRGAIMEPGSYPDKAIPPA